MTFMHCILVVFLFAVGKAELLGGTTRWGRDDPIVLPKAQEALFASDLRQKSGVFHKLVTLEESSTMGISTTMEVVLQDTDCQVSSEQFSSYSDVLAKCEGHGQQKICTIQYKYRNPSTATVTCIEEVEELIVPTIVPRRGQMLGETTKYTDSDSLVKEKVKQAIFESDRKKTRGTYLVLDKIEEGSTMGISSSFQVLVKETACPIRVKAFDSYEELYKKCSGFGDSKRCTVEYKYFDPTKSTLLGGTTRWGRDDPIVLPKAQEALFASDLRQKSGVFHKLVTLEESSTMGISTTMKVLLQDTDCQVSSEQFSSYSDVLAKCEGHGQQKICTIQYKYRNPSTATVTCIEEVEELIVPTIVPRRAPMLGGTTKYTDSDSLVKEKVKQAIFESDRKKTRGTYLVLDKIVEGSTMGISSSFEVLVKETACPIRVKAFDSYEEVYAKCPGFGDSKKCTVEYRYLDPTKSTVEC
ncbi:hypothetical protein T4E_9 [Trichinella pseudospiralis]|uniref:Uncharacterized protein n=1 Tax=Trichinella pseudospiralis TaxID=6337 RepID=A0A0V0YCA8_TRIPS|nr:hypothetical protein T4E_9 [Trichinella pseudospiralis]